MFFTVNGGTLIYNSITVISLTIIVIKDLRLLKSEFNEYRNALAYWPNKYFLEK